LNKQTAECLLDQSYWKYTRWQNLVLWYNWKTSWKTYNPDCTALPWQSIT